jgi:hypothetical protein
MFHVEHNQNSLEMRLVGTNLSPDFKNSGKPMKI